MSDVETRYHESWLGMVQPVEGLVVSVPVLVEAQCMHRQQPSFQQAFLDVCPPIDPPAPKAPKDTPIGPRHVRELPAFLEAVLEWTPDLYDSADAPPDDLSLYVPEGKQTLRPTLALKRQSKPSPEEGTTTETPAAQAGARYAALLWDVEDGLDLDKPETTTGPWEYPAAAKFDRLLRQCRVPIGVLTNRRELRLFYAPHGESSGVIRFKLDDMASVGGRPILDAFVMLMSAYRFFGALAERQLPAILSESRKRQVNVTNQLADQVFDALQLLLRGFEAAGERDSQYAMLLRDALERDNDHLYGGLLTVLLRLVFLLYAEDRGLLPVETKFYTKNFSVLTLFDELQHDHGAYPDSMSRRFGAWPRLLALFRAVFLGCKHGDLKMPQRRGELFDPHIHPFLEGWGPAGSAPITLAENRAEVAVPGVDDETIFRVLQKLILLEGQRLSYRALDVEQIGSVYEALMGYHVQRLAAASICLKPDRAKAVWVSTVEVLEQKKNQRAKWLKEEVGLTKATAAKIAGALAGAKSEADGQGILEGFRARHSEIAKAGGLVIQPGSERKRTSSHYTPRSLSAPIVEKTLAPLIAVIGDEPSSERLLNLKVCDPAMGSGAFLVEACRFLADQVVAAWTREQRLDKVADEHEDVVNHARRLVAQRCLYGVDKNRFAVNLAKLSLWLVTLARDEPFSFVDHALRHGDSLVGLDFEQIKCFHWKPGQQIETCRVALGTALDEAIALRQQILDLAAEGDAASTKEKYRLLHDAEDALQPVRLVGDLVVGAYFSATKDKDRQKERDRRLALVEQWLESGGPAPSKLVEMQEEIHARFPVFHWMTEFLEVFYAGRPDPLASDTVNRAAYLDAILGNPPFMGVAFITARFGEGYVPWLQTCHSETIGKFDLCVHFFRRADVLLGEHGTIGLIATNTIAQGDTRATGLQHLVTQGHVIYDATRSMMWPGDAAVNVSVVHTAKGLVTKHALCLRLDGEPAQAINSRLRPKPERPDPAAIADNAGCAYVGSYVLGMGFILTQAQRHHLVWRDKRNADRIFEILGGVEVNTSPTQSPHRYVISFERMELEETEAWPDLISILRRKVKPERDLLRLTSSSKAYKTYWWRFARWSKDCYSKIRQLERCLVAARVTKHLCFSFQPTDRILNEKLYVFPFDHYTQFAILQSRAHQTWAWLLSSTMKTDLNYSASDCFNTFPFPKFDPGSVIAEIEDIGERLYEMRAKYMVDTDRGLTKFYNQLTKPDCTEPRIVELRQLHREMDHAVFAAYGWEDIEVPPYITPTTPEEEKALKAFQDEIIDRLFVLNAERAKEEKLAGAGSKRTKGKGKNKATTKRKKTGNKNQLGLLDEESK
jgi:Eco57I restriction-modification methylase/MmeI, target recognition domain